jgi:hypothetical protein
MVQGSATAARTLTSFVVSIPRWGRAIRLYAQSLAEHGAGLADWKAAIAQLAGEDPESRLAQDLFLDGKRNSMRCSFVLVPILYSTRRWDGDNG